jgi:hypothetical protein
MQQLNPLPPDDLGMVMMREIFEIIELEGIDMSRPFRPFMQIDRPLGIFRIILKDCSYYESRLFRRIGLSIMRDNYTQEFVGIEILLPQFIAKRLGGSH